MPGTRDRDQEASGGLVGVYAVAAAAGMYTLYYFVFLLIPLNLWVLWQIALANGESAGNRSPSPLAPNHSSFQLPASSLAPRQSRRRVAIRTVDSGRLPAGDEPARPALAHRARSLARAARELDRAQPGPVRAELALARAAADAGAVWAGVVCATANGKPALVAMPQAYGAHRPSSFVLRPFVILPIATLGPLALILLVSLVTPLYHVRYLFTYSPAFYVVMAAGLAWLLRRSKVVFAVALGVWLAAAGVTLHAYWHDPAYRADDHRAAVRYLREHWRPGDVVLVNAGWPYTALTTYWDGPIATRSRLTGDLPATPDDPNALVMVTTGHVDGDPGLGWGDPRSDFFAMPADVAREQIAALFGQVRARLAISHLRHRERPGGQVRGWLAEDGQLADDQVFAGEANMRVQGFVPRQAAAAEADWPSAAFGTDLSVHVGRSPARSPAARRSTRRWSGTSPAHPPTSPRRSG